MYHCDKSGKLIKLENRLTKTGRSMTSFIWISYEHFVTRPEFSEHEAKIIIDCVDCQVGLKFI